MIDPVLDAFLRSQHEEGMALAAASDILDLHAVDPAPSRHYVATFRCRGLVRGPGGVVGADRFVMGIQLSSDYLRHVDPFQTVFVFEPIGVWHPNIRAPFVCIGKIRPATPLTDLLYRTFELVTYSKCTMREDDALNREACSWARQHRSRFPLERRPLKWRSPKEENKEETGPRGEVSDAVR